MVFKDARYLYALRLDTQNADKQAEHHARFLELVGSVQPIPLPSAAPRIAGALPDHWAS